MSLSVTLSLPATVRSAGVALAVSGLSFADHLPVLSAVVSSLSAPKVTVIFSPLSAVPQMGDRDALLQHHVIGNDAGQLDLRLQSDGD